MRGWKDMGMIVANGIALALKDPLAMRISRYEIQACSAIIQLRASRHNIRHSTTLPWNFDPLNPKYCTRISKILALIPNSMDGHPGVLPCDPQTCADIIPRYRPCIPSLLTMGLSAIKSGASFRGNGRDVGIGFRVSPDEIEPIIR
jgi:hypothetical protein